MVDVSRLSFEEIRDAVSGLSNPVLEQLVDGPLPDKDNDGYDCRAKTEWKALAGTLSYARCVAIYFAAQVELAAREKITELKQLAVERRAEAEGHHGDERDVPEGEADAYHAAATKALGLAQGGQ